MSESKELLVCSQCNKYMYDGTIVQINEKHYHTDCVRCVVCQENITGSCHRKDNELYCRTDFLRLHGTNCLSCDEIIGPSEAVHEINGRVYHTSCFTCIECTRQLNTGDFVYLKDDGKLLCSNDYQVTIATDNTHQETDSESDESGSDDTDVHPHTTLNDLRQRALEETYSDNKRPSKKTRRQLSKNLNLTERTVQMWFHNRRVKDKCIHTPNSSSPPKKRHTVEYFGTTKPRKAVKSWSGDKPKIQKSCFENKTSRVSNQTSCTNNSDSMPTNFQPYFPLDYLLPDEIAPNVNLSSADICNGEVIPGKHNTSNYYSMRQTPLPECLSQWLTA
ncbi:LIM domain kinase 1 [Mactra antiquata]